MEFLLKIVPTVNFLSNILYAFPITIDLNENPVSLLKFLLKVQGLIS